MRLHGLVALSFAGLFTAAMAQDFPAPRLLPVPSARPAPVPDAGFAAPVPLPLLATESEAGTSLEEELRQLRSELKAFGAAREDVSRSTRAVDAESDRVSIQQRQELLNLLTKLATQGVTRRASPPATPAAQPVRAVEPPPPIPDAVAKLTNVPLTSGVVDPFALGKVLLRSGDYAAAEQAFRKVKATDENRMMLKYLSATCLRKQAQWQPATDAYRVVAESDQDPVLRDLAKWQLDNIRWHQQTESQLEQMRKQRETAVSPSKTQSADATDVKP
ncbi:MAG: hypothetical protein AABP62_04385 [Planctomycetota bacterium]